MSDPYNLKRFVEAQNAGNPSTYHQALGEMTNGRKELHWIWYVLPQILLGDSQRSRDYAIKSLNEARAYLQHDLLRSRYLDISGAIRHQLCAVPTQIDPEYLMGSQSDVTKLISSATLFNAVAASSGDDEVASVLQDILEFLSDREGVDVRCVKTLAWLKQEGLNS